MIMQVHDELVLEVHENDLDPVMQGIRACMAKAAVLSVSLEVDVGVGSNWDQAH